MSNLTRLVISVLVSAVLSVICYMGAFTPLVYFFLPGFWLSDLLPLSVVNALGGGLFPVFASALIWALIIFLVWWLIARRGGGRRR